MKEKLKAPLVQPILTGISYFIPIICMGGLRSPSARFSAGPMWRKPREPSHSICTRADP